MAAWTITGSYNVEQLEQFLKSLLVSLLVSLYLVTLKVRSSLTHLRTERPRGGMTSWKVRTISSKLLSTTKKSNRLNSETK